MILRAHPFRSLCACTFGERSGVVQGSISSQWPDIHGDGIVHQQPEAYGERGILLMLCTTDGHWAATRARQL